MRVSDTEFEFYTDTGTVKGATIWSETSVHGSSCGGGGFIQNGTGYVHSPTTQISSHAHERSRFFLCFNDGREEEFRDAVSATDGQSVSILSFARRDNGRRYGLGTYNRNTTSFKPSTDLEVYLADQGLRPPYESPFGLNRDTVTAGVVALGVFVVGAYINGPSWKNIVILAIVAVGVRLYVRHRCHGARQTISGDCERMRRAIIERGRSYL